MGVRKNYRSLTSAERDRFVQALHHVKSAGAVDRFAQLHDEHFSHGIHRSSHFLPWHREFLLLFENELRAHHPDITIPYWDSTADRSPDDPLWDDDFLGQFDAAWDLDRVLGSDVLPTLEQVLANRGREGYAGFWPELESDIHNPPHRWVGGVMASRASPGDPIFYFHHCWIDLLWVLWQLRHPQAEFVSSGTGLGLNDPLMGWPNRTPADVLNHYSLGYSYDVEPILQVEGRPVFLRAHDLGTKFGPPSDQLDVEVVVRLDTRPDGVLGFKLRADGNEGAARGMLDILRFAFNDNRRVRLDYRRTGTKNGVLLRVVKLP